MSTRANIIIKDDYDKLYFYRHSDGYPEGTLPTLEKFTEMVNSGKIRNNAGQSAGWLIILGAIEYQTLKPELFSEVGKSYLDRDYDKIESSIKSLNPIKDFKCGAYEPTTGIHGDIEYLYEINLAEKPCKVKIITDNHNKY